MSFSHLYQSLKVCIAALIPIPTHPNRPSLVTVRAMAGQKRQRSTFIRTSMRTSVAAAGIALSSFQYAAAQEATPAPDSAAVAGDSVNAVNPEIFVADPNPIMGFDVVGDWTFQSAVVTRAFNVALTTQRTEGRAAFAINNPPVKMTLTSVPISSTTKALAGIGNTGAILQMDLRIQPAATSIITKEELSSAAAVPSYIEGFVSVKSLSLSNVPLGQVSIQKLRTGIYNTVSFAIPESVSAALKGKTFNDLTFTFTVNTPTALKGAYLLDNLRVHSVELVQTPKGDAPPVGYGQSVDLAVTGPKGISGTFILAPTQIPAGFHLKTGVAAATIVQFQLGLDSTPELSCLYAADPSDKTNQSYILQSCTNGYVPGDLVTSNWASLVILRGSSGQQLTAKLSLSPLGGLSGPGLIPPMPTFWGTSDSCTPAPGPNSVQTISTSCKTQVDTANKIITGYFNAVNSTHPTSDWVVAPIPDAAVSLGNLLPFKDLGGSGAVGTNVPFSTGGDLNPGGSFDAYWRLSGNLDPTAVPNTDENLTHFDAAFTTHGVMFGHDIDVVDAKVSADTDSGETTPNYKAATSKGTLGFYVFGEEIPSGGLSFSPSTSFSVDPSWSQEYDLPPIEVWIFDITLGAFVEADLKASGSAALSGADISVVPTATLGGHISGGINIGVASGEVDAKINLLSLSAPASAQAKWVINNDPALCAATVNGSLKGTVNVGSGGGEVDLDATFGVCPLCYTDSYTLFKWNSLVNKSYTLFNDTIDVQLFALPTSMCKMPTSVSIVSPTSGATLTSGLPVTLTGSATPTEASLSTTSTYAWTYTPGAHAGTITINPAGATSANPTVTFGPPTSGTTSTWTIGMKATTTLHTAAGTTITTTGTATPVTVTVSSIKPGVYISQITSSTNGIAIADPSTGVYNVGNIPGTVTIAGVVSGGTGTLNSTFNLVYCNDYTPQCTSPSAPIAVTTTGAATRTPSASFAFGEGYYKVTLTTTAGTTTIGTATAVMDGYELF
jgi:hypothetical protein